MSDISIQIPFLTGQFWIVLGVAYLLGSIPFGLVLSPIFKVGDIRKIGSGNIGASNALRTGNKIYAISVLICDMLKGALAVIATTYYFTTPSYAVLAGFAAVIGHIFPIWLKFKGGKGVATTFGAIIALSPAMALCAALTWIVTARVWRYSSLAALVSLSLLPAFSFLHQHGQFVWLWQSPLYSIDIFQLFLFPIVIIWAHRSNIRRLIKGEELKLGKRA